MLYDSLGASTLKSSNPSFLLYWKNIVFVSMSLPPIVKSNHVPKSFLEA